MESKEKVTQPHMGAATLLREFVERESVFARLFRRLGRKAVHDGMAENLPDGADFPTPQLLSQWARRGWASPMHFPALVPLLGEGETIMDLYRDMHRARVLERLARGANTSGE